MEAEAPRITISTRAVNRTIINFIQEATETKDSQIKVKMFMKMKWDKTTMIIMILKMALR
jgi:RNA-binding protein YhbY